MTYKLKFFFIASHRLLLNFGINIKLLKNLIFFPKYLLDFYKYKKEGKIDYFYPILGDNKKKAGDLDSHYFQQDLLVAKYIFKKKPKKHVDIGSRIDGFVSHVGSFREIEIFDIRKIKVKFNNIIFKKLNLTNVKSRYFNYTDSLSCLHTIEHLGLGRYGDKIDVNGHLTGFNNLIKILKKRGRLYVSLPISEFDRTYFNAHRTFNPLDILNWSKNNIILERFDYINDNGELKINKNIKKENFKNLIHGLGIYTFVKR
jgi:hypothetical protein